MTHEHMRAWFPEPEDAMSVEAVASMRFALQAAARRAAVERKPSRGRRPMFLAAAACLLLIGWVVQAAIRSSVQPSPREGASARPIELHRPATVAVPASAEKLPGTLANEPAPARKTVRPVPANPRHGSRRVSTARGAEPAVVEQAGGTLDAEFRNAWRLYRAGRTDAAAYAFDAMTERGDLGRRSADVLFWSARSHLAAGRPERAEQRLEALLRAQPDAWHADEARRLLERMK